MKTWREVVKKHVAAAKKSGKPAILTTILPEAKKEWDQIKKNLGLPLSKSNKSKKVSKSKKSHKVDKLHKSKKSTKSTKSTKSKKSKKLRKSRKSKKGKKSKRGKKGGACNVCEGGGESPTKVGHSKTKRNTPQSKEDHARRSRERQAMHETRGDPHTGSPK